MLQVDDLAFGFGARRVGSDVTFALDPGETLAVLGGTPLGFVAFLGSGVGILVVSIVLTMQARGASSPAPSPPTT